MAEQIGYQLLQKTPVQLAIAEARKQLQERTQVTADRVVMELGLIAFADARELAEVKSSCCRCCWGEGFKFQRTVGEYTPSTKNCGGHRARRHGSLAGVPPVPPGVPPCGAPQTRMNTGCSTCSTCTTAKPSMCG
ncbi:terminase small subunit [Comamonas sp. J-3]|uniref:terminase small subunit n=1 Tax=Comamonas trifloxystrobinivorans TaxID=3350256 RepID=UPI00372CEB58